MAGRKPGDRALRGDRTINPDAYVVTETGCHLWTRWHLDGAPIASYRQRQIRVRQWLLDLPPRSLVDSTCGNDLCVNRDHLRPHLRKDHQPEFRATPLHTLSKAERAARDERTAEELRKPATELRTLALVRADIARLLDEMPAGIVGDDMREDLRAYASGATYAAIGARRGRTRQAIEHRLRRADRQLRIAAADGRTTDPGAS